MQLRFCSPSASFISAEVMEILVFPLKKIGAACSVLGSGRGNV